MNTACCMVMWHVRAGVSSSMPVWVAPMAMHGLAHAGREPATAAAAAAEDVPFVSPHPSCVCSVLWCPYHTQPCPVFQCCGVHIAPRPALNRASGRSSCLRCTLTKPVARSSVFRNKSGMCALCNLGCLQTFSTVATSSFEEVAATGHPNTVFQLYVIR